MIRQLPIIPTVLVLSAAATMVWLGIWQLGRADEKAALLALYAGAQENAEEVAFPLAGDGSDVWYRRSTIDCLEVLSVESTAGTAETGAKGWAHRARCLVNEDDAIRVDIGFSREPQPPQWDGGEVKGVIAPGPRLVANPAKAGLEPLAKPDPSALPNNHLAYAGQWFFFALTALIIYWFAVRARITKRD